MRALTFWFRFSFETCPRIAALLATFLYYWRISKAISEPSRCHLAKARDLRNVVALINEKEIAKLEGEANVQVL